jgi:hypothetical protein
MKAERVRLNGTYRMKAEVFNGCTQADGTRFTSPDVTIVRIKQRAGYKTFWYYDANGNAFQASDFKAETPSIGIEL